jgi:hypothetical protein
MQSASDVLIQVENVSKAFGSLKAVDAVKPTPPPSFPGGRNDEDQSRPRRTGRTMRNELCHL